MPKPTPEAYGELQDAYDFFNGELFGGRLPPCLITFQRNRRSLGYFSGDRWDGSGGRKTDEIALNPMFFKERGMVDTLSTLVHEMVHLEQHHFGKPGRGRYHNLEWARWMERVGLVPSETEEPGGRKTGQKMSHYIASGGAFEAACQELLERGFALSWAEHLEDAPEEELGPDGLPNPKVTRAKFTCSQCGLNAWAKPKAPLVCGDCKEAMTEDAEPLSKSAL